MRNQLSTATAAIIASDTQISTRLETCLAEERKQADEERQKLLTQITSLVNVSGSVQNDRLSGKVNAIRNDMAAARSDFSTSTKVYGDSMDTWSKKESLLVEEIIKSRESLKGKMKRDWTAVNEHNTSIQATTRSVHEETVRIVDAQMKDMAVQMQALDDFVKRARSQNESHHESHAQSLRDLASSVKDTCAKTGDHLGSTLDRFNSFDAEMKSGQASLQETLAPLESTLRQPLSDLRQQILATPLTEYTPTGETPQKSHYQYPTTLPRTAAHSKILADSAHADPQTEKSVLTSNPPSPTKSIVYTDAPDDDVALIRPASSDGTSLREIPVNMHASLTRHSEPLASTKTEMENLSSSLMGPPPLKRHATMESKLPTKYSGAKAGVLRAEGRENAVPLGAVAGRRLRSSNADGS